MEIDDLVREFKPGSTGRVVTSQTTSVEIDCVIPDIGLHRFRIHYYGKREVRSMHPTSFALLRIEREHPLLLEYKEPMYSIQLVSEVKDKPVFLEEVNKAAKAVFDGWRSPDDYGFMPLAQFIQENFGIMMIAPKSFAEAVMEAAERCNVKLSVKQDRQPDCVSPVVLLLDSMYVIANDFTVDRIS